MPTPPAPNDLIRLVLEQFFGKASVVVFVFIVVTVALAWISALRTTQGFAGIAGSFFSRTVDRFDASSGKLKSTVALAISWCVWYGLASLITQLWAGSSYSRGQGNGLAELLTWSVMFGLVTVIGALAFLPGDYDGSGVYLALIGGYFFGLLYAVVWFTQKGGPRPGDWYIAPAASCCLVLIAVAIARLRAVGRTQRS